MTVCAPANPFRRRADSFALIGLGAIALVAVSPRPAGAWGSTGHRAIATHYGDSLPLALQALRVNDAWIIQHVMDPDARKSSVPSEGYRHYIDIDAYPEYSLGTLSHDRAVLEATWGVSVVQSRGIVPWAIAEVVDSMSTAMATANWDLVKLLTADLCHYVGDIHQPLHCTQNYDGQMTGNNGVHSRYESTMLNTYSAQLVLTPGTAEYEASPLETAFGDAGDSQSIVASLLAADTAAKAAAGGSTSSATYYAALWNATQTMTLARLSAAAVTTASLLTTAWLDAGSPVVPGSLVDAGAGDQTAAGGPVLLAFPSPTGGAISVRYAFATGGPGSLAVFDASGRRVATLVQGEQAKGGAWLSWRPSDASASPGVYFLRIEQAGRSAETRVVFSR